MVPASTLKHVSSLRIPKYRELHGLTLAEGTRLVSEMMQCGYPFEQAFATEDWVSQHDALATQMGERLSVCSGKELERMSAMKAPQGVLAVLKMPENPRPLPGCDLSLFCDRISDPGNLGTILRIADWFGIGQVVTAPGSVSMYSPKVIQASMGSWFRVHHSATPLADTIAAFPEPPQVFGAVIDGTPLNQARISKPAVIVIGNESEGIVPETLAHCTQRITIPGNPAKSRTASAESLNAAIAAAVLCYHFTSQT